MEVKTGLWKQTAKQSGKIYFSGYDNGIRVTAFLSKEGKLAVRFIVESGDKDNREVVADVALFRNDKKDNANAPLYNFIGKFGDDAITTTQDTDEEVPF